MADFLNRGSWTLVSECVEIASGGEDDWPELAQALAMCRIRNAVVITAKMGIRVCLRMVSHSRLPDRRVELRKAGGARQVSANKIRPGLLAGAAACSLCKPGL